MTIAASRVRRSVLRSAHRRSREKLRAVAARGRSGPSAAAAAVAAAIGDALGRLAAVSSNLAVGFGVIAKTTRDAHLARECASLAAAHRAIAEEVAAVAATLGISVPSVRSTCGERLRWEWLASSARLLDGTAELRLVGECARLQREASELAASLPMDVAAAARTAVRQVVTDLDRASAIARRIARQPQLYRPVPAPT
jgi:hypothetical protein